jgi:hypothetical protein
VVEGIIIIADPFVFSTIVRSSSGCAALLPSSPAILRHGQRAVRAGARGPAGVNDGGEIEEVERRILGVRRQRFIEAKLYPFKDYVSLEGEVEWRSSVQKLLQ